jgi:hypothetical protein
MNELLPDPAQHENHHMLRKIAGIGAIAAGVVLTLKFGHVYWEAGTEPIADGNATAGAVSALGGAWLLLTANERD